MKSIKPSNLIYILILISCISCRRKGDASGRVFNILNGEPIEGIEIHLDEHKVKAITDKTVTRPIAKTSTGSSGEYSFKYGPKLGSGYNRVISVSDVHFRDMDTSAVYDRKYDIGNYPGCEKVKWDYSGHSRTNQDFYIAPFARIKVMPHNVTHMFDGISMRVDLFDENYSKLAVYFNYGNATNTDYYTQFPSNGKIYIAWEFQGSPYQTFYDTIFVEPFAKTTYHFNY